MPVGKASGAREAEITKDLQMRDLVHGDLHIASRFGFFVIFAIVPFHPCTVLPTTVKCAYQEHCRGTLQYEITLASSE